MNAREEGLRAAVEALAATTIEGDINGHKVPLPIVWAADLHAILAEHPATPADPPKTLDTMRSLGYLPPAVPDAGDAGEGLTSALTIALVDTMRGTHMGNALDEIDALALAESLAPLCAARERKAAEQAWWAGHLDGCEDTGRLNPTSHRDLHYPLNPYRADRIAGDA